MKAAEETELDVKKIEHKLQRLRKEYSEAQNLAKSMSKKHPWIASEKQL